MALLTTNSVRRDSRYRKHNSVNSFETMSYSCCSTLPRPRSSIHFRLQAAIFDFSLTPTHGSVWISPVVLLDIENIGIAVEISLISHLQAQIDVLPYPLPVTGRHLWYITHPDVGEYSHYSPTVFLGLKNSGCTPRGLRYKNRAAVWCKLNRFDLNVINISVPVYLVQKQKQNTADGNSHFFSSQESTDVNNISITLPL